MPSQQLCDPFLRPPPRSGDRTSDPAFSLRTEQDCRRQRAIVVKGLLLERAGKLEEASKAFTSAGRVSGGWHLTAWYLVQDVSDQQLAVLYTVERSGTVRRWELPKE